MTNEEMKMALAKGGVAEADIEKVSDKFDAEKITEIVEGASSPKVAFENLHAFYPELEVEKLQKQCDFVQQQVEASLKEQKQSEAVELTEEELENVAGGGWFSDVGSWFKNNWKAVAVGAAIVVGTALICTGVGAAIGAVVAQSAVAASSTSLLSTLAAAGITDVAISAASSAAIVGAGAASGAAVGALVGTAVGGAATAVLAGTGVLGKVN